MLNHLKIARPGLWFPTIWMYLVPFSLQDAFYTSIVFWIGLVFVTFPLNYLVYGLNDYNDYTFDALNQRKGNFLFGAKFTEAQLKHLPFKIALVVIPFMIYFTIIRGYNMLLLLAAMIVINVVYNYKPFRVKERPPFEIFIQIGYVLTAVFSTQLNGLPNLPWQTLCYLTLFAFQAHIAGEIMDIEPDLQSGKQTTATVIGRKHAKLVMLILLLIETYILWFWFNDFVLALFLGVFSIWLVLDIWVFFKHKPYSVKQMKLFGIAMNICAIASMIWVLYANKLLYPRF